MSQSGQKQTSWPAPPKSVLRPEADVGAALQHVGLGPRADLSNCNKRGLFDHFVGAQQGRRWNGDAEQRCRLEIQDELELRGPVDRSFGWTASLQNSSCQDAGVAKVTEKIGP